MDDKGQPDTRPSTVLRHEGKDFVSMDEYLRLNQRYRDFYSQRWIPVGEELPEDGRKVLAFDEHFPIVQSARRNGSRWDCEGLDFLNPTHWMPLPAPPTDAK